MDGQSGLTPWRVTGLICLAVALLAIAVMDAASPASTVSCKGAERSQEANLIGQAKSEYAAILSKEPTSDCAQTKKGVARLGAKLCARGKQLTKEKAAAEASTVYIEALHLEPLDATTRQCTATGLHGLESSAPESGCSKTSKMPCVVTIVHVNARNGRNGANGRTGANGRNGKDGLNGANGRNGLNGTNGKTVIEKRYYGDCHEGPHDCYPATPSPCGREGCS